MLLVLLVLEDAGGKWGNARRFKHINYFTNGLFLFHAFKMEPISDKIKKYLQRKLEDCEKNLRKQKRKRKRIKTLYITTILLSILISGVVATLSPNHFSASAIIIRRNSNSDKFEIQFPE